MSISVRRKRVCDCACETIQSWRYLKEIDVENACEQASLELELEISEPITVTYSDRSCPRCCEYSSSER